MHPQQKAAWFNLIVCAGAVALYALTVLISWSLHRQWTSVAVSSLGIFGLIGFTGFGYFFYRPGSDGKPVMDERDRLLAVRAWQAGMAIFWIVFVLGCVGSWAFMQYVRGLDRITVPTELFPAIAFAAFIIVTIAQSAATLCYYGWRSPDAAER